MDAHTPDALRVGHASIRSKATSSVRLARIRATSSSVDRALIAELRTGGVEEAGADDRGEVPVIKGAAATPEGEVTDGAGDAPGPADDSTEAAEGEALEEETAALPDVGVTVELGPTGDVEAGMRRVGTRPLWTGWRWG